MMMYAHEWHGKDSEYDELVEDLGKERVRVVAAINWNSDKVQIFDDNKKGWVVVTPGDYILGSKGKVWVSNGR